jgi:hypothetical protein
LGKPPANIPRRRGRPSGLKNKPKNITPVTNVTKENAEWVALVTQNVAEKDDAWAASIIQTSDFQGTWEEFVTQKKLEDAQLAEKLRREGKITTPGKLFKLFDQTEINGLIGLGIFRFEQYNPIKHGGIRIFKSRIMNEIKGKGTNKPYEKSRFVIQGYNDDGKLFVLTQNPIIQRSSQRILLAITPALLRKGMFLWLRDVTQAYTQSESPLQRTILAELPE